MCTILHEVIGGASGDGVVICKHASNKIVPNPSFDVELHKEDIEVFELIHGSDTIFSPSSPQSLPLPFSDLKDHVDKNPPMLLLHIVYDDQLSDHDKTPKGTPGGIAIARYASDAVGSPGIIRAFNDVELLLNHGSRDIPGNPFMLRSAISQGSKETEAPKVASESCQTPFWHAKSLDRFSSGGWHLRLFTLTSSHSDHLATSTETSANKVPEGTE